MTCHLLWTGGCQIARAFLDVTSYRNVARWSDEIWQRLAVQRGRIVNRTHGDPSE